MAYADDIDFLRVLSEESLKTADVARELDLSDRQARKRLSRLVDDGLVEREGKGSATWSLTDEGRDAVDA